jgi:hypothetical protein
MYPLVLQAYELKVLPSQILDPYGELSGITIYYFNNAAFVYWAYLSDKKIPLDFSDAVDSNSNSGLEKLLAMSNRNKEMADNGEQVEPKPLTSTIEFLKG